MPSRDLFARALENSPNLVSITGIEDGRVFAVSEGFCRVSGYSREEVIGRTTLDIGIWAHPEDRVRLLSLVPQHGKVKDFKTTLRTKDGRDVGVLVSTELIESRGKPYMLMTGIDVTEQEAAEERLRQKISELDAVLDSLPDLYFRCDAAGRFLEYRANRPGDLLVPPEQFLGKTFEDVLPPYLVPRVRQALERALQEKAQEILEYPLVLNGHENYYEARFTPLGENQVIVLVRNITLRHEASRLHGALFAISETAEQTADLPAFFAAVHRIFSSLMDARNFYIALYHPGDQTVSFPYFVDQFDPQPSPRRLGRGLTEYVLRTGQPLLASEADVQALVEAGEIEVIGTPGLDWLGIPLKVEDRTLGVLVIQSYDPQVHFTSREKKILTFVSQHIARVLDRRLAEEALRRSEERYRTLFENLTQAVLWFDHDGRLLTANPATERILGLSASELRRTGGKPEILQVMNDKGQLVPEVEFPYLEVIRSGQPVTQRLLGIWNPRENQVRWVNCTALPLFPAGESGPCQVILTGEDVTERRRMEQELIKAQKLESLGVLAGGIAHDFNNILTSVLGNLSLAREVSPPEISSILADAEKASLRARDLTQQLLTFSRGGSPVRQAASIADLVRESIGFTLTGSKVKCHFDITPDLWMVEVDESQINQVLQNLVINAVQAMPGGGLIFTSAWNCVLERTSGLPLPAGRYVKIVIRDTGQGIPPSALQSIFDPYFTTKPNGTGLGLAIAYSVVQRHGGHITVESKVGSGTAFTIWLPASLKTVKKITPQESEVLPGRGRILLMDDDEGVLKVGMKMLNRLHYECEVTRDGEEMLERVVTAREEGNPFDLVLMDLTIPGKMGGKEAVHHLRQIEPKLKAVVSSGYSNDPVMAQYRDYGFDGVVAKPYRLADLGRVLRDLL